MSEAASRTRWSLPVRNRHLLLTRGRRRAMPPAKTLRALGLKRGMSFLDVGCGPGYFSIPACGVVGKYGRVLACDTSPVMIDELRAQAKERGYAHLTAKRCENPRVPFPDASADFALVAFVLHGMADVQPLLAESRRTMGKNAVITLIDWHRKPMDMGPPLEARIEPGELVAELSEAGFLRARWWDFDGNTYFASAQAG